MDSVTVNGIETALSQNMFYYESGKAQENPTLRASGAYIFRPNSTTPKNILNKDVGSVPVKIYRGKINRIIALNN
jgi:hypothetical protein